MMSSNGLHRWKFYMKGLSAIAAGCSLMLPAHGAELYPSRPIRLIVPFAPGGGVDFVGRILGQTMGESLRTPIIVDNRGGAGGVIGSELGARATPDGYTLTMGNNSTHGVNQALNSKLPYDTIRDFSPVSLVAIGQNLLVVSNNVPAKSIKELIAIARLKPGAINFGSAGEGSQTHLSAELFKYVTKTDMVHIPYKGIGPALTALVAGREVSLMFASMTGSLPHVEAGRLRALGVTGNSRTQFAPNIPTVAEQGIKGFETGLFYVLLGPAGLPQPLVMRLHKEVSRAVQVTTVRDRFLSQGAEPVGGSPAECAAIIRNELAIWTKLATAIGLRK